MVRRLATALVASLLIAVGAPIAAHAHEPGMSAVLLDLGDEQVTGELQIPLDRLEIALGLPLAAQPSSAVADNRDVLVAYVADHFDVTGPGGETWTVGLGDPRAEQVDAVAHLVVPLELTPPGALVTDFVVHTDVVLEHVRSHEIVVAAGTGGERDVVGLINHARQDVTVSSVVDAGFGLMVRQGFDHVRAGLDHQLFLLVLLLPAPLVAAGGKWERSDRSWLPLLRLLRVVTAFTLGHSVTLIASTLGWVTAPTRPVEVVIAISVGVGALHALRPLVGGREALIAGAFGLVHGLAFAELLANLGLTRSSALLPLLGFNVGVELAQLAGVALIFPSLYLFSRTRYYDRVRLVGGGLALAAALAWLVNRLGLGPNVIEALEAAAISAPVPLAAALALLALLATATDRRSRTGAAVDRQERSATDQPAAIAGPRR